MGQLMSENKWVALRVNVTLVGIERKSIYFNNDPAKTLESLNGDSISRITAVDSSNLLIEFDFQITTLYMNINGMLSYGTMF